MQLGKIQVKNFRLLHDVELLLEKKTTVIVGRNNSGKTSLTELMRRLLLEKQITFRLQDFSFSCHKNFWDAFLAFSAGNEDEARRLVPAIEARLTFSYDVAEPLDVLADIIVDLSPDCTEALLVVRYDLQDGRLGGLFEGFASTNDDQRPAFFAALRERIQLNFAARLFAVDPSDPSNEREIEPAILRNICLGGLITAQRGLDDTTQKDRAVIGKVLETLFSTAQSNPEDEGPHQTAKDLEQAVKGVQETMGVDFNKKLDALLPALSMFGYPGLVDPKLLTETTFDVKQLLTGHTKVLYTGMNGVHLPEAYNGLGMRNIILILLQLREFFKVFSATAPRPATQIIFIEEPEVHLHPQMQEVFIRKLNEIANSFSEEAGHEWPVQFVVSTHSSHLANEAHFETIRYFHCTTDRSSGIPKTSVKDLRKGLAEKNEPDRSFLHQYMTLTRCDLFFADKAILIEGTTERLLLPKMIAMLDEESAGANNLGSQYISINEVGGAYAHLFFDLLEFLELKTLIVTDIDAVQKNAKNRYEACPVSSGERTSNACISSWFQPGVSPKELLAADAAAKTKRRNRIAFQLPEADGGPCGRSFEDAFLLANPTEPVSGKSAGELEKLAWADARDVKKSEFALDLLLRRGGWKTPRYIREGLEWLRDNDEPAGEPVAVEPVPV